MFLAFDIGKTNLGFAIFDGVELKFGLFDIDKHINKYVKEFGRNGARIIVLCDLMNKLLQHYNIKFVVVESQLKVNPTAQSIQSAIMTIAFINKIKVKPYKAVNKFKYLNEHYNSKKKEHKKISIQYCYNIIYNLGYSDEFFKQFQKKDDIADSVCMAVMSYFEYYNQPNTIKELLIKNDNTYLIRTLSNELRFIENKFKR